MLLLGERSLPNGFRQTPRKEACGFAGTPADVTKEKVVMHIAVEVPSNSVNKPKIAKNKNNKANKQECARSRSRASYPSARSRHLPFTI